MSRRRSADLARLPRQPSTAPLVPIGSPDDGSTTPLPAGYAVLDQIGRGGMGTVYRAVQESLGRVVAIKVAGRGNDPQVTARFQIEAEAMARVVHPHVAQVYDFQASPRPSIIMEFCPGGDLWGRIRRGQRLSPRDAVRLLEPVALGLAACHAAGVIHRDVKPGNISLDAAARPKLIDFGLAKLSGRADPAGSRWALRPAGDELTRTGDVMGTPSYMSPEQAAGRSEFSDPRTDVYGFGATLFELLTGRPPFRGETSADTLYKVRFEEPPAVRQINHDVPRDLEAVCRKCLEKDPARRYPSADAMASDLHRFLLGKSVTARPTSAAGRLVQGAIGLVRRALPSLRAAGQRTAEVRSPEGTALAPAGEAAVPPRTEGTIPRPVGSRPESLFVLRSSSGEATGSAGYRPEEPTRVATPSELRMLPPPSENSNFDIALDASNSSEMQTLPPPPPADLPLAPPSGGDARWRRTRPSCLGLLAPTAWVRPQVDPVDCSVFAPPSVPAAADFLVQVFAHLPARRAEAAGRAAEADPAARPRGSPVIAAELPRDTPLDVRLELPAPFAVPDPWQRLVWNGHTTAVQFLATAPAGPAPGVYGTVRVFRAGVPCGHLRFRLEVTPAGSAPQPPEPLGTDGHWYRRVFVSYASPDRAEVLKRVQALKAARLTVFQDVLDLEPGDRWQKELYRHIDGCDLFLVCWSAAARKSEWVRKELRYAKDRRDASPDGRPAIVPVLLDGPPPPDPPTELRDELHWNDKLLYMLNPPAA